jgi:PPOX class probable F420-dependent enzyme
MSEQTPVNDLLASHKYISLTTFRKSGKGVATPVWFVQSDGRLCVWTLAGSGKVKRLRNNSRITLAPCTVRGKILGPGIEGEARIVSDQAKEEARQFFVKKYGWQAHFFAFLHRKQERLALEITPDH